MVFLFVYIGAQGLFSCSLYFTRTHRHSTFLLGLFTTKNFYKTFWTSTISLSKLFPFCLLFWSSNVEKILVHLICSCCSDSVVALRFLACHLLQHAGFACCCSCNETAQLFCLVVLLCFSVRLWRFLLFLNTFLTFIQILTSSALWKCRYAVGCYRAFQCVRGSGWFLFSQTLCKTPQHLKHKCSIYALLWKWCLLGVGNGDILPAQTKRLLFLLSKKSKTQKGKLSSDHFWKWMLEKGLVLCFRAELTQHWFVLLSRTFFKKSLIHFLCCACWTSKHENLVMLWTKVNFKGIKCRGW